MSGVRLWALWVGAVLAAGAVALGIAFGAGRLAAAAVGAPTTLAARGAELSLGVAAGALQGAIFGFAQAAVLRRALPRVGRRAWIGATAAAGALGWLIGAIPVSVLAAADRAGPPVTPPLVVMLGAGAALGLVLGALLGGAQWLVLRRAARRQPLGAAGWIVANALGWAAGLALIVLGAAALQRDAKIETVALVMAGCGALAVLVLGAVTGWALVRIARRAAP